MSGDLTTETSNPIVQQAEPVSESYTNQSEKKEKRNYCYVCNIQCKGDKNFKDHQHGRKHLKRLASSSSPQQDPKKNTSKKSSNQSKKASNNSSQSGKKSREKNKNIQNHNLPDKVNDTMNRYNPTHRYDSPAYDNRYLNRPAPKYPYSNNYRKPYYNNRPFNWYADSYPNHFNYRPRHHFYPPVENNRFFYNHYNNYGESSHGRDYEQNYEEGLPNEDVSQEDIPSDPFNQQYSEETVSSSKKNQDTSIDNADVTNASNANETSVDNNSESVSLTKNDNRSPKISVIISKTGKKRVVCRSRSQSSTESDKRGKDKVDQADCEESEEQRIQEWTNSLLETNNNQITRLINPSNHKEKAAVNHLVTKFSKAKRKEILSRTLRTNSSELTDKDVDDEDVSAEVVSNEDEEISVVLDSRVETSSSEQNTDLHTSAPSKTNNSKSNITNQKQSDQNIESCKSPINQSPKKNSKNNELPKDISKKSSNNKRSPFRNKGKIVKRKSVGSDAKVSKKQRTNSLGSRNVTNLTTSNILSEDDRRKVATPESVSCSENIMHIIQATNPDPVVPEIKNEIPTCGTSEPSTSTGSEKRSEENLVFNPDVSVETLIQLFASGNVQVKEEFNDPVMDALREINPDELINACSNNPKNTCEGTANKDSTVNENCISPIILGSAAIENNASSITAPVANNSAKSCDLNETVCSSSAAQPTEPLLPTSSASDHSELSHLNHSSSSTEVDKSVDNSLSTSTKSEDCKVGLPPYLNKLINELQNITSEEEKIKQGLVEAKSKINEYTCLLDEWKRKKKLLHDMEEDLRKRRNNIINLMQNPTKTDEDDEKKSITSLKDDKLSCQSPSVKIQVPVNNAPVVSAPKSSTPTPSSLNKKQQKKKKTEPTPSPRSPESDDIIIIPAPEKPQPPEIIICDDEEPIFSQTKNLRHEMNIGQLSSKGTSVYDLKHVNAHSTVINSLVVFEEFLYTCANDNTARRFSLKDASQTVTYLHTNKNVTEVVVEKVQNEALVFTACSAGVISLFIASSGTKIKNFFPPCPVISICKGWGKFYAGLGNGCVNVYNWKYEEIEIVKTQQPASRIATAHQGRLHVLIILSSEGNISIRDAETGLLIRCVKIFIKHPSWMCLHNDLVYLSSSDKSLNILDIMSGRIEKKLHLNSFATGLAVYGDFIFTIAYSGIINCYNKDNSSDKRIFYGAGKSGLTCLHVYQNWVFTGNRKGDVSLFHFDPSSSFAPCEFAKCDIVYGLKEDLAYHIEKDHLLRKKLLLQCNWKGCSFKFPRGSDMMDKMNHIRTHIYQ